MYIYICFMPFLMLQSISISHYTLYIINKKAFFKNNLYIYIYIYIYITYIYIYIYIIYIYIIYICNIYNAIGVILVTHIVNFEHISHFVLVILH